MANGGKDHSVIMIEAGKTEWLLHPSAGNKSCCIFRVPQCLAEIHPKTYQPHIVSIGPYHYGNPDLQMMQEHKQRYLGDMLTRTASTGPKLDEYLQAVESREKDIRDCYSENIKFDSADLAKIMVLDGLFIIELFCKEFGLVSPPQNNGDDPIFNLAWMKPNLIRDLLRLENQIPFFVLQILLDTGHDSALSLSKHALEFISNAIERPEEVLNQQFEAKHLLDLVRLSFTPIPLDTPKPLDHPSHPLQDKKLKNTPSLLLSFPSARTPLKGIKSNAWEAVKKLLAGLKSKTEKADTVQSEETTHGGESVQLIKSARKLYKSGIKFKTVEAAMSFLEIKFSKGVLEIPHITLDDLHANLLMNFVAFEQHRYFHCEGQITSYAMFMGCLIRTPEDATFLCENNIIENYLGSDEDVADFFRNLGKGLTFHLDASHLRNFFEEVNEYQKNVWHVRWAGFKFTYFDTPWSFLSALAAFILLLLTVLQTFYAVYAYYHP